ncbi:MAG: hypothetical protein HY978_01665 [Candidatus Liptonbacteria bacterium]|nr:hypothetical protein [Candidatus Liptonbacteria bacterium]
MQRQRSAPHTLLPTPYSLLPAPGQAALSLVFLIGGIIILIGVTVAFLSFSSVNTSFGFQSAQSAEDVAAAGANDALLQIVRNKSFASAGYAMPLGSNSATVTVAQNSPATNQATITSQATVSGYVRKLQVVVEINATTGQTSILSWQSLTL